MTPFLVGASYQFLSSGQYPLSNYAYTTPQLTCTINQMGRLAPSAGQEAFVSHLTFGAKPKISLAVQVTLLLYALFGHSALAEAANVTLKVVLPASNPGSVTATGGINCTPACSASYAAGTTVKLNAWPDGNSVFGGWSVGACGVSPTCAVTLNADTTVAATFNGPGGGGGSSSSSRSSRAPCRWNRSED